MFIWEFWAKFPQGYFYRWFSAFIMQVERHVKISSLQLKQRTITDICPKSSKIGPFYKNCILTYFISICKFLWNIWFMTILGVIIESGLWRNLSTLLSLYLKLSTKWPLSELGARNWVAQQWNYRNAHGCLDCGNHLLTVFYTWNLFLTVFSPIFLKCMLLLKVKWI